MKSWHIFSLIIIWGLLFVLISLVPWDKNVENIGLSPSGEPSVPTEQGFIFGISAFLIGLLVVAGATILILIFYD